MSYLPNEIWCLILRKLKYIDVLNLSLVSKKFHELCVSDKEYIKRLRLSKQIISYDADLWFEFLNQTFNYLSEDTEADCEDAFAKRKFVFLIVRIKLKKIAFKLLPFKIYNHLFFCHRGARSPGKCNFCTRYYVEEPDQILFIEKTFRVNDYAVQHTDISKLFF